jgi:hypothetical protein
MAGPLTWRDVAPPDFRGSMEGLRLSGAAMDRAFTGLNEGLGRFDEWRRREAENAVLNAAQNFTNPAQLREAIANGAVFSGVDRGLVGREALSALNNQAGALLGQAVSQQRLNTDQQLDPLRIRSANTEALYGERTLDDRVSQVGAQLAATRQRMALASAEAARSRSSYADGTAGQAAGVQAARSAASTDDFIRSLEQLNLTPGAYARALAVGCSHGLSAHWSRGSWWRHWW